MTKRTLVASAIASASVAAGPAAFAQAVTVPNTFNDGEPAAASEVNENFSALADEVEMLGEATTGAAFADYFLPPSANGTLGNRNVIVWKREFDDGSACYRARGWFNNEVGESAALANGPDDPETIFVWQELCGDQSDVTFELEYVYTLPSDEFVGDMGIEINLDDGGNQVVDETTENAYRYSTTVDSLGGSQVINNTELYLDSDGSVVNANNWTKTVHDLGESITVNGMTFDDVAVASFTGFGRTRFMAKDIGPILEVNGFQNSDPIFEFDQSQQGVIFYRVDGQQEGSLAGTPFDGGPSINTWFQE